MENTEMTLELAKERIAELESMLAQRSEPTNCGRCGRPANAGPVTLSEKVKREYFRSLLGQRPFSHTFSAYGGLYRVTFTTLSGEALAIQRANNRAARRDDVALDSYLAELNTTNLVGTLTKIETFDADSRITNTVYEASAEDRLKYVSDPVTAYDALLNKLDQLQITIVRKASDAFIMLCTLLAELGDDQDFYEGAGLL